MLGEKNLRREIAASARQDGDVDVVTGGDFAHQAAEAVVVVLGEGIELLGLIESDDGDFPLSGKGDCILECSHCSGVDPGLSRSTEGKCCQELAGR